MKIKNKLLLVSAALLFGITATSCGDAPDTSTGPNPGSAKYTYNAYLSASPTTWNVHTWEENTDSYIQSFTEMGLYDCIYNKDSVTGKEGYIFVNEMAAEMPILVDSAELTDEEIETYGYKGNPGSNIVWDFKLNPNAKFENGEAINADTYVESMERLLNPKMVNRRADSYYSGNLVLANAERYFKQQRTSEEPAYNYIKDSTNGTPTDKNFNDGMYYLNLGAYTPYAESVFSNLGAEDANFYTVLENRSSPATDAAELARQRIVDAAQYYIFTYEKDVWSKKTDDVWETVKKETGKPSDISSAEMFAEFYINIRGFDRATPVNVRVTKDVTPNYDDKSTYEVYSYNKLLADLKTFVGTIGSNRGATGKTWAWKLPLFGNYFNDDNLDFSEVGIKKVDDHTIRFYLAKPITELDLKFSLTSNWIVNLDLYDQLTETMGGIKRTKWATDNASNYIGYGPYKLTYFKTDDSFTLTKNENWYGWTDGNHEGQFAMTDLKCRIIKTHETVKEEFKKGLLDEFTLERSDMEELGNSSRVQYTPESYTTKISFNSDFSKLKSRQTDGINKTMLANDDFRKGISLIIDRKEFIKNTTAGQAYNYLLNSLYLTDVEKGESYRSTNQAKNVYNAVYSELGGPEGGQPLAEGVKGLNYEYGLKLIKDACLAEIASGKDGALKTGDNIQIEFRVFDDTSDVTISMWNYLNNLFKRAFEDINIGVSAEIKLTKDEDYYNTAKQGNYDMIFSTWGGAAINPWGLMQVYLAKDYDGCCEYGFKGKQDQYVLDIDVNGDGEIGADESKDYNTWYTYLTDQFLEELRADYETQEEFEAAYEIRHNQRLNILAGLEAGIVSQFRAIPLYARNSADIMSFKVDNITATYINLIGYGGIRFMKFNYSDAEWKSAIDSGKITYDSYKI